MIGALLLPILASALAQAPPADPSSAEPSEGAAAERPPEAVEDLATPGLRVRREARRPYPRRLYDDLSVERRCVVDVTLDARGRPTSVEPVDCPPELVDFTRRRVRRDRWERPVPEGARARVDVVYRPPAEFSELPAPDYWRRRELGACELRVTVDPDGHTRIARDDAGCAPRLADWSPTPPDALRGKVPKVCAVTFLLVDGEVRGLDLFRCDLGLWRHVREGLARLDWPATPTPAPYTVQLEFGGR